MNQIASATAAEVARNASIPEAEFRQVTTDTKVSVSAAVMPQAAEPVVARQRQHQFDLDVVTGDGRMVGTFVTRVLSIGESISVGIMRARLLDSRETDNMTATMAEMVAHCEVALVKRPDWAKDLLGLLDIATVEAIYTEVVSHEKTFRESRIAAR